MSDVRTQKISPFLWYNTEAEEAVNFYVSIFKNSKITDMKRYGDSWPGPAGTVMWITFELEWMEFMALNGGPHFKFTPAVSLYVKCENQEEVDDLWGKFLDAGGREDMCGWLQDKYGLSWQIIPRQLEVLMGDKDPDKAKKVMDAMMKMKKIEVGELEKAYNGG